MARYNALAPKLALASATLALVTALCPTAVIAEELVADELVANGSVQEQVAEETAPQVEGEALPEASVDANASDTVDEALAADTAAQEVTEVADEEDPEATADVEEALVADAAEGDELADEAAQSETEVGDAGNATPAPESGAMEQSTAAADEPLQEEAAQLEPQATNKWASGKWNVRKINGVYYRFWISQDGEAYKNGLVLPEWGTGSNKAGYYAWAKPDGTIVTGTVPYTDGTYIWLADNDGRLMNVGWNVTSFYTGDLQRYYIVDEGKHAAKIGLDTGNGSGNWAHYTLKEGYVLRGKYKQSSSVTYVADNDGKLPTTKGWSVTGIYDGQLQRYYFADYAAKTGTFVVDGAHYLGVEGAGYVLRGYDTDHLAYADNDGKLTTNGWMVTDRFGHGLQRYWLGSDGFALRSAVVNAKQAGYYAYARPEGYVVRGKYVVGNNIYIANNDGRLASDGWVVSSAYGDGLQRYYINAKTHSAVVGYSTDGYAHYTLPQGYVLRGAYQKGDWVYLADNDGRAPTLTTAGWLVSDKYHGSGLQRYYLQKASDGAWAAKVGYSSDGYAHYTLPQGYVLRGAYQKGDWVYLADNDGRTPSLSKAGWQVTDRYGSGFQRYYLQKASDGAWAAKVGYSESGGYAHYTLEKVGYVLRNGEINVEGKGWLFADNDGKLEKAKSGVAAIIEKYLGWAINIANDNSHGYSQIDRWGPDYDCSSLVLSALEYAGLDIGYASYTGNMISELVPRGWTQISYNGIPASLVRGDILLAHNQDTQHVEFYLGGNMRIGAHEDENGGIGYGARSGDQTGEEICTRTGVGNWFTWVLRLARA